MRLKLVTLLIVLGLIPSFGFAQTGGDSAGQLDMEQMKKAMQGIQLDKAQIGNMIETMKKQGMITDDQAGEAMQELSGMSDSEINLLKNKAIEKATSGETQELPKNGAIGGDMPQVKANEQAPDLTETDSHNDDGSGETPENKADDKSGENQEEAQEKKLLDALKYLNQ